MVRRRFGICAEKLVDIVSKCIHKIIGTAYSLTELIGWIGHSQICSKRASIDGLRTIVRISP